MTEQRHSIVIRRKHLAPELRAQIGNYFGNTFSSTVGRLMGMDKTFDLLVRKLDSLTMEESYHLNKVLNTRRNHNSVRGMRLSRVATAANLPLTISKLSPYAAVHLVNLVEATRTLQFLHHEMAREMNQSKVVVDPRYADHYSTEEKNTTLLSKTHPIFYVTVNGDLVFLPITRIEYARYLFQQKRLGKLGLQPWLWRGYLDTPKAPQPWKEWAKQKMRQWSERFVPAPIPQGALVQHARRAPRFARQPQRKVRH